LLGTLQYSRYNFTDLKRPYDGVDAFAVAKLAFWLDSNKSLGPFAQAIPVITTEDEFFFQRHLQGDLGMQAYPFEAVWGSAKVRPRWYRWARAVRLFVQGSGRAYYNDRGEDLKDTDLQAGVDYYYDNLFFVEEKTKKGERFAYFLFTNVLPGDQLQF
jgi:hypothetical protein